MPAGGVHGVFASGGHDWLRRPRPTATLFDQPCRLPAPRAGHV